MLDFNQAYAELLDLFESLREDSEHREKYQSDTSSRGARNLEHYSRRVKEDDRLIIELLKDLVRFPPHHDRHFAIMQAFHVNGATHDDAVFIMTKFPDAADPSPDNVRLTEVISHVIKRLKTNGYHPRIASEKRKPYHPNLWDNVEAYLFCCGNAVAIVQDKYGLSFNPNVAMEWGWTRAVKKNVLYLINSDHKIEHMPADTAGMLHEKFTWDDPKPGILQAIDKYFPKR